MALLHEARGEINLAISEYRKEQEVSPYNYKPDFNLGLLYHKNNKLHKALEEYKKALELDPKMEEARRALESLAPGTPAQEMSP